MVDPVEEDVLIVAAAGLVPVVCGVEEGAGAPEGESGDCRRW